MSADTPRQLVPETLDAWRLVTARRGYEGRFPLASMPRLGTSLLEPEGDATFSVEFDRDSLGVAYVELKVSAELPLLCQRTLERFLLPVRIDQRLGLIRSEADEAALPEGYEPLLLDESGELVTRDLVEDELILAVPVVPVMPGTEAVDQEWAGSGPQSPEKPNPFAVLAALKKPGE